MLHDTPPWEQLTNQQVSIVLSQPHLRIKQEHACQLAKVRAQLPPHPVQVCKEHKPLSRERALKTHPSSALLLVLSLLEARPRAGQLSSVGLFLHPLAKCEHGPARKALWENLSATQEHSEEENSQNDMEKGLHASLARSMVWGSHLDSKSLCIFGEGDREAGKLTEHLKPFT